MTKFNTRKVVTIKLLSIGLSYRIPSAFVHLISLSRFLMFRSKTLFLLVSKTSLIICILLSFSQLIKLSRTSPKLLLVLIYSSEFITENNYLSFKFLFIISELLQFNLQLDESIIYSATFLRFLF